MSSELCHETLGPVLTQLVLQMAGSGPLSVPVETHSGSGPKQEVYIYTHNEAGEGAA